MKNNTHRYPTMILKTSDPILILFSNINNMSRIYRKGLYIKRWWNTFIRENYSYFGSNRTYTYIKLHNRIGTYTKEEDSHNERSKLKIYITAKIRQPNELPGKTCSMLDRIRYKIRLSMDLTSLGRTWRNLGHEIFVPLKKARFLFYFGGEWIWLVQKDDPGWMGEYCSRVLYRRGRYARGGTHQSGLG